MEEKDYNNKMKIISVIDKIRPFIMNDGGNIELVDYKDNIVYIRLSGACKDCSMIDITIKDGIEELIISEVPDVKEVINVD